MHQLLSSIFFGAWLIEPSRAELFLPEVQRMLAGTSRSLSLDELQAYRLEHQPKMMDENGVVNADDIGPTTKQYVMVLPIHGPIIREDANCGPVGMETRANWLRQAFADPNILGVVVDMDSPGGSGTGMEVFVQQLKKANKPVLTYVNFGMAASAGYGIASHTREIMISGPGDILGSIGTYMTFPNMKKHLAEHFKLDLHEVYATASTEKNLPIREALLADHNDPNDKHYELLRKELLDPINEQFIAMVKAGRPQLKDGNGIFNGRLVMGEEAIALGLADSMGTLEDAVQRVRQLAKADKSAKTTTPNNSTTTETNTTMSFKTQLTAALAGFATLFATKEDRTTEAIAAVNAQLAADGIDDVKLATVAELALAATAQSQVAEALAKVTTAEGLTTAAEAKAAGLQTALEAANMEITKLKGQAAPATGAEGAVSTVGDPDPSTPTNEVLVADLPHNKAAREARARR